MQSMSEETPQPQSQSAQQKLSKKTAWAAILITARAMWQQRRKLSTEKEKEKLIEDLRKVGVTDEHLPFVLLIIDTVGKGLRDQEETHRLDRYLVGGCAILDLVLFQIVASSTADATIHISWIALATSLPCTMGSLFFSFLRNNPKRYGKPHSTFSSLAILSTLISATALIWHFWIPAGIIFLIVSLLVGFLCLCYAAVLTIRKHFPKPPDPPAEPEIFYG